jgi:cell division transport system permease protein
MKRKDNRSVAKRFLHSYLSSLISITLVLVLAGTGGLVVVNASGMRDYFKENLKLSVIFDTNVSEEGALTLTDVIAAKTFVKKTDFISKEEGTNEMKTILGDDFLEVFDLNPVPISADVYVKSNYVHPDSLKLIEAEILLNPGIREVVWEESLIEIVNNNLEKIALILLVFVSLLLFISFFLINNTVRLNVFSKRFTIYTMKLVGAKRAFIRKPFLINGLIQGLVSGMLAVGILSFILYFVRRDFQQMYELMDPFLVIYLFAGVILSGIILCLVSTWIVLNKVLSLPADDLYY